jgi:hypothetical protein
MRKMSPQSLNTRAVTSAARLIRGPGALCAGQGRRAPRGNVSGAAAHHRLRWLAAAPLRRAYRHGTPVPTTSVSPVTGSTGTGARLRWRLWVVRWCRAISRRVARALQNRPRQLSRRPVQQAPWSRGRTEGLAQGLRRCCVRRQFGRVRETGCGVFVRSSSPKSPAVRVDRAVGVHRA